MVLKLWHLALEITQSKSWMKKIVYIQYIFLNCGAGENDQKYFMSQKNKSYNTRWSKTKLFIRSNNNEARIFVTHDIKTTFTGKEIDAWEKSRVVKKNQWYDKSKQ